MYIVLFLLWVIFNGRFTVEIAAFGVVIVAAITWFMTKYLNYRLLAPSVAVRKTLQALKYFGILILEIIKANIQVIKIIVNMKYEVEPKIVRFRTTLKSNTAKTALANSITLTPGTITVNVVEDEFTVLCLDKDFSEGLEDSCFVKMLTKMEE